MKHLITVSFTEEEMARVAEALARLPDRTGVPRPSGWERRAATPEFLAEFMRLAVLRWVSDALEKGS